MSFVLNTNEVDEVDRAEFVHEAPGMTQVQIELHWPGRDLHKVLAEGGSNLAEWIRTRRLEACRQILSKVSETTTVVSSARRSGFADCLASATLYLPNTTLSPSEWCERCTQQVRQLPRQPVKTNEIPCWKEIS